MERVKEDFACEVVSAWEERIWLDRREVARPAVLPASCHGRFGRMLEWMRRFRSRMQLGPIVGDDWLHGS
jgi:hypothetical protein